MREFTKITNEGKAGYSIRASAKGWIVETWSSIQGEQTETKHLVSYDVLSAWKGLDKLHDKFITNALWVLSHRGKHKVLRQGRKVL